MLLVAGLIPEGTIARILESIDIVDLIGRYFPLRRAGQGFTALCPFHNEKTPSFHVSPQRQIYHCFGCGKGGNAIGFVMEMEKVSFPEAASILAERCGVRIERRAGGWSDKRKNLYEVLNWAARVFERNLAAPGGEAAREYLRSRGVSSESTTNFRLGYSMPGWDSLIRGARSEGMETKALEAAGLIISRETGGHYDRFRNRLMFPISDAHGKIVGFGARTLDPEESAKYVNSPETPVFGKGKLLYGLAQARNAIFREKRAVVVEGYTDVIMAHQYGFTNVVATLGTAVGRDHIRQLKRFAPQCTLVFDADAAGQKASDSSLQIFVEEELDVSVAAPPEGKDPCECLTDLGPEAFGSCLDGALGIFEYKLKAAETGAQLDPKAAGAIVDGVLDLVARIPNAVERRIRLDGLVKMLDGRLGAAQESVRRRLAQMRSKPGRRSFQRQESASEDRESAARSDTPAVEREFIRVCLHDSTLFPRLAGTVGSSDFTHAGLRSIFEASVGLLEEEGSIQPARLSARLVEPEHASLVAELLSEADGSTDYEGRLESCLKIFQRRKEAQRIRDVRQQMLAAAREGDADRAHRLQLEYARLEQEHLVTFEEE